MHVLAEFILFSMGFVFMAQLAEGVLMIPYLLAWVAFCW